MNKKTYMAPEVKTFMLESLQVIAASPEAPKVNIVEDEEYNPNATFSIHQNWTNSDMEDED